MKTVAVNNVLSFLQSPTVKYIKPFSFTTSSAQAVSIPAVNISGSDRLYVLSSVYLNSITVSSTNIYKNANNVYYQYTRTSPYYAQIYFTEYIVQKGSWNPVTKKFNTPADIAASGLTFTLTPYFAGADGFIVVVGDNNNSYTFTSYNNYYGNFNNSSQSYQYTHIAPYSTNSSTRINHQDTFGTRITFWAWTALGTSGSTAYPSLLYSGNGTYQQQNASGYLTGAGITYTYGTGPSWTTESLTMPSSVAGSYWNVNAWGCFSWTLV